MDVAGGLFEESGVGAPAAGVLYFFSGVITEAGEQSVNNARKWPGQQDKSK